MTRIIAGAWGGRRLVTPSGSGTRPTSDRVRESLFSSVQSAFGSLDGVRVLDLYAGSGALGLEALSRGAKQADLVESGRPAIQAIAKNIAALGASAARLHRTTVERFLLSTTDSFELVLLDPPYREPIDSVLAAVVPVVAPDGLVVVERSSRDPLTWPPGLSASRDKAYGETQLWYGHLS